MSLWILKIEHPYYSDMALNWYFNDHEQFQRAKEIAYQQGVLIETRTDYITSADEFKTWLQERR